MISSRPSPEERTISAYSRCCSFSGVSSSSPVMPITPFSGVRSSWLTVATNIDLAFEASTAWSRASALASRGPPGFAEREHQPHDDGDDALLAEHQRQQVGPLEVVDDQHARREQAQRDRRDDRRRRARPRRLRARRGDPGREADQRAAPTGQVTSSSAVGHIGVVAGLQR